MKLIIEISEGIYKHIDTIQNGSIGAKQILNAVKDGIPAYKAIPNNVGHWEKIESGDKDFPESIVCSNCGCENSHFDFGIGTEPIGKVFVTSKFCPNCGCPMEIER